MNETLTSRRGFLKNIGRSAGAVAMLVPLQNSIRAARPLHIACNQYTWQEYYRREGRDFFAVLDEGLREVSTAGIDGFEPLGASPEQLETLMPLLRKRGLEMRSLYVNSWLHEKDKVDSSINEILQIAAKAREMGTRIIVTNPSPIRWGGPENKTDPELRTQASALNRLGESLSSMGLQLAYHNHDIELRMAAREFHHMLTGTDSQLVHLCLDAHWIYRGAGNSLVALADVVELYGSRVIELHIRQSNNGTWSETFDEGDIDYRSLAGSLHALGVKPHLVLEQAVEEGSPSTLNPLESHRRSIEYARRIFAVFQQ